MRNAAPAQGRGGGGRASYEYRCEETDAKSILKETNKAFTLAGCAEDVTRYGTTVRFLETKLTPPRAEDKAVYKRSRKIN
ncbi:hypothetical protein EVAR_62124_1 [Eumeta japonica]|uniref:Uncharacterized protein n=1 Tax=Eumeta variegata TaxID=151549 RepID=A0A4C1ZAW4_EUMVA|nr:hypothetical protein EVAR_62124_1 [Eumeta japonica]